MGSPEWMHQMFKRMTLRTERGPWTKRVQLHSIKIYGRLGSHVQHSVASFTSHLLPPPSRTTYSILQLEDRDIEKQLRQRLFLHFFTMAYFVGFFWFSTLKEGGFYQPNSQPCGKRVIITLQESLATESCNISGVNGVWISPTVIIFLCFLSLRLGGWVFDTSTASQIRCPTSTWKCIMVEQHPVDPRGDFIRITLDSCLYCQLASAAE